MTIEKRVKILERRLSVTRWLLLLIILTFVGSITWTSKTIIPVVEAQQANNDRKVLRFKTFILEDEDGKILGVWGTSNEGNPILHFYDKNGKARVSIGMNKIGAEVLPQFLLLDEDEIQRIGLFSKKEGPMLLLSRKNSTGILSAIYNGDPSIRMLDEKGTNRIGLVIKKDAQAVVLADENGKIVDGLGK